MELFQELVLQLESRTHVERIQFMSSLNMVATCVEILLGEEPGYQDDPDFKKAKFMSVGQVKFQNPAKRELKVLWSQFGELGWAELIKYNFYPRIEFIDLWKYQEFKKSYFEGFC